MRSESAFRRLVNFSDAVVAIAITLLILPLVDSASSIGSMGVGEFFKDNRARLFAFALSFAVIGSFWWAQHKMFERVKSYNAVLVWGMFIWLFSIVFLPFPTELIGSTRENSTIVHEIYIGTLLAAAIATLVQQWAIVRWPALQEVEYRGSATIDAAGVSAVLMSVAFVVAGLAPSVGLWALLVLLLSTPLERLLRARRSKRETSRR